MVATVDEAADFAARCRAAGLDRAGIMIETPAAALLAAELFEVVDFVSLGTNDLAQYTLAADRLSSALADLNDPWQPAVLRLIGTVGAAGRAAGKPVGICGEAAGDPALDAVGPDDCRRAADGASRAATAAEARQAAALVLGGGGAG